jgi:predicted O-methyltransferase YrrM
MTSSVKPFRRGLVRWRRRLKPLLPPIAVDLYRLLYPTPLQRTLREAPFDLPERTLEQLYAPAGSQTVTLALAHVRHYDEWAVPPAEQLSLAGICTLARPRRVFEIGTYTGVSTLIMALNTADDTEIFTLDIPPATRQTHQHGMGVGNYPEFTVGGAYQGHPAARKITQLYGDSRTFDFSPYYGTVDMVFVDADHTYEFVKADTERALRLLRPGGTIVWDDYTWIERHPECAGVTRCLNELARTRPVFHLAGTRFGIYVDRP